MEENYTSETARVEVGFNRHWMTENPKLAADAVLKFVDDHPAADWSLSVLPDEMPGMTFKLVAKRRRSMLEIKG